MQSQNVENFVFLVELPKMGEKMTTLSRTPFKYELINGQKFVSLKRIVEEKNFRHFIIDFGATSMVISSSPDFLTSAEIEDVEASFDEMKKGKIKKFRNVADFLAELKK